MTETEVVPALSRAAELSELLDAVQDLVVAFVDDADHAADERARGGPARLADGALPTRTALVEPLTPDAVVARLQLLLPEGEGGGQSAVLALVRRVLALSVNTWDQGFLDKLYGSTTPVGLAADLVLSTLNTNVHVFAVAPALAVVEKTTGRALARRFGFTGPHAGGVTMPGGSAANLTSLVLARNTLFPATKKEGNGTFRFVLLTSAHGHYSMEKAAQAAGMGADAAVAVAVDAAGRMRADALEQAIADARAAGRTPLYVNATAGTTVLGAYDPFEAVADICVRHGLWFHVDASWGGPAIFSATQAHKLAGSGRARSLTVNPHKMMNVPTTCSYLLSPDLRELHAATTLPAGYLFHEGSRDMDSTVGGPPHTVEADSTAPFPADAVWDLADLTLQCGRHGDSLKLALAWVFEGATGFGRRVDHAFAMATRLADALATRPDRFALVSTNPPPCLQVCFYLVGRSGTTAMSDVSAANTQRTRAAAQLLVRRGFMVDFAPGPQGSFLRVVLNWQTRPETVDGLVLALEAVWEGVA